MKKDLAAFLFPFLFRIVWVSRLLVLFSHQPWLIITLQAAYLAVFCQFLQSWLRLFVVVVRPSIIQLVYYYCYQVTVTFKPLSPPQQLPPSNLKILWPIFQHFYHLFWGPLSIILVFYFLSNLFPFSNLVLIFSHQLF